MFDFLRRSSPLWRHRDFNRLWTAQALSAFGNRITRTALPIIAVDMLAATPAEVAILSALSLAPFILAGLGFGGFVERTNKLRLMVGMDLVRFLIVMAAPVAFLLHALSLPLLCIVAVTQGFATALFANADTSILPRLVEKDHLVEGNSRIQATESFAELTGPAAAGLLIGYLSAPVAMIGNALTFLWSAFWLGRIPKDVASPSESLKSEAQENEPALTHLWRDITVGFHATMQRPPLRAIFLATSTFYVAGGFFFSLYMLFMLRIIGLKPEVIGAIISVGGLSALIGSVSARPLARRIGFGPAIIFGFTLSALGVVLLLPAAYFKAWAVPLMIGQQLLGDGGIMIYMILATSLQQKLLPRDEIARANGLNQAMSGFGMTLAILLAGGLAEWIGVPGAVMAGAGVGLIGILPLLTPALLGMREEPAGRPDDAEPEKEEAA